MDYGNAISDSYVYTRSLIGENIPRWIVLALGVIIFPVIIGYLIRVAKGEEEKPNLDNFGELFIQGIIGFIIALVYGIIALVVIVVIAAIFILAFGGIFGAGMMGSQVADMSFLGDGVFAAVMAAMYGCMFLAYAIGIPLLFAYSVIVLCALFRYARTGQFGEAFNFNAITTHIRSIGWINFVTGLLIMQLFQAVLFYFFCAIGTLIAIPFIIGGIIAIMVLIVILAILFLLFVVVMEIFSVKYYSSLYDSGISDTPVE